jgi:LacI family transcriptional regulator
MSQSSMSKRAISMDDVAREVGLSRTTVSFVLNDRMDIQIPDETRERVWAAAQRLGYRPNIAAQSLAQQQTNLIGLITDITSSPFAGGIIHGAQEAAWKQDKFLLIVGTEGDPGKEEAALEMLLERRVQGVIFATQAHRMIRIPLAAREVPTVLVHCFDSEAEFPSVLPDEESGGHLATSRLIDAGHRRVALINLDPGLPATIGREAGYRRALKENGIPVDESIIVNGHATAAGGFEQAGKLLTLPNAPTAFFCANDRIAMGAFDAVKELGLHIPSDVAVVGYDNQEIIAAYLRPALTTVALPFDQMGAAAVDMVAAMSAGAIAGHLTILCPLVERNSV